MRWNFRLQAMKSAVSMLVDDPENYIQSTLPNMGWYCILCWTAELRMKYIFRLHIRTHYSFITISINIYMAHLCSTNRTSHPFCAGVCEKYFHKEWPWSYECSVRRADYCRFSFIYMCSVGLNYFINIFSFGLYSRVVWRCANMPVMMCCVYADFAIKLNI